MAEKYKIHVVEKTCNDFLPSARKRKNRNHVAKCGHCGTPYLSVKKYSQYGEYWTWEELVPSL